ncbi:asparagine--tRNA ligase [Sodalis sp. CWE]|uniref:asparagine--tRNA ligase n=1 Tax=Sodalis sp. CWE TaxID=2803816 RepID=UPI001C7D6D93|nr:asparagine--tRNA ligase [Sodalis sp. CWE]MBX4181127.1 asparagine--tRNA ligase [Sodalis sp. CWE]
MNIVYVTDILRGSISSDQEIILRGWVRTRRDSNIGISFLTIYDGSCFDAVQTVISSTLPNYKKDVLRLTTGCSVSVVGRVIRSFGRKQNYEIQVKTITVIGWVESPDTYPIATKRHSVEYLREVAHLRPRTNLIGAITRVRNTLAQAIHRFMEKQGFLWISTPLITTSNTEGSGEMFHVTAFDLENLPYLSDGKVDYRKDFFGKKTFLTVSGQLNCESYACALSKVYTFGPTFRAENSNTSRHLAEFWMVEPEIAFSTLDDAINLAEKMLKYLFRTILQEREDDMQFFAKQIYKEAISHLVYCINTDFAKINYTEAITILQKHNQKFEKPIFWGHNLSLEHERFLVEKYFKSPLVIKNYPKDIKAFYMRMNDDQRTVAAMDILMPNIGEIIGGSQREERLNLLDQRLTETGLNKENYWWYRDLRRYGSVPHAGFGLGFERLIAYITGMKNIRDTIPFPRSSRNANF